MVKKYIEMMTFTELMGVADVDDPYQVIIRSGSRPSQFCDSTMLVSKPDRSHRSVYPERTKRCGGSGLVSRLVPCNVLYVPHTLATSLLFSVVMNLA